jgi:hypothetical protein
LGLWTRMILAMTRMRISECIDLDDLLFVLSILSYKSTQYLTPIVPDTQLKGTQLREVRESMF